ncbi:MAG: DUF4342 domain-containing protein [Chloroflexota bacterium]
MTSCWPKFRELVHEGNVRRLIIKSDSGIKLLEVPLTIGVIGAATDNRRLRAAGPPSTGRSGSRPHSAPGTVPRAVRPRPIRRPPR